MCVCVCQVEHGNYFLINTKGEQEHTARDAPGRALALHTPFSYTCRGYIHFGEGFGSLTVYIMGIYSKSALTLYNCFNRKKKKIYITKLYIYRGIYESY